MRLTASLVEVGSLLCYFDDVLAIYIFSVTSATTTVATVLLLPSYIDTTDNGSPLLLTACAH